MDPYNVVTKSAQITTIIRDVVSRENHIGFAMTDNQLAIAFGHKVSVLLVDKYSEYDICLLINSENVDKIVFSKFNTLVTLRSTFNDISCNSFIDLYDFAKEKNKMAIYKNIQRDFEYDITETHNKNGILASEAYHALIGYERINNKTIEIPSFNAFCLFSQLNVINSELSKKNKIKEDKLFEIVGEREFELSLQGYKLPCEFNKEIYSFLLDNDLLTIKKKVVKIIDNH